MSGDVTGFWLSLICDVCSDCGPVVVKLVRMKILHKRLSQSYLKEIFTVLINYHALMRSFLTFTFSKFFRFTSPDQIHSRNASPPDSTQCQTRSTWVDQINADQCSSFHFVSFPWPYMTLWLLNLFYSQVLHTEEEISFSFGSFWWVSRWRVRSSTGRSGNSGCWKKGQRYFCS